MSCPNGSGGEERRGEEKDGERRGRGKREGREGRREGAMPDGEVLRIEQCSAE